MARNFSKSFYKGKAWRTTRASYISKVHGLCERCLEQGRYTPCEDVHHKILLNEANIHDPSVSLNHEHLIALCKVCHNMAHSDGSPVREGLTFNENGELVKR